MPPSAFPAGSSSLESMVELPLALLATALRLQDDIAAESAAAAAASLLNKADDGMTSEPVLSHHAIAAVNGASQLPLGR